MNTPVLDARRVPAKRGMDWILGGFALFRRSPVIWIVLILIYLLIAAALSLLGVFGLILFNLVAPVLIAGFMIGCRELENGEELEIRHLFAGFQQHAPQLITVGGLYMAGFIIIIGIMSTGIDEATMQAIQSGKELTPEEAEAILSGGFLLSWLSGLLLLFPLIMAYWFAPPLAVFHGLSGWAAMKESFKACLRNIAPFFLYSLVLMILLAIASIPMKTQATAVLSLIALFVMIPTMVASLYMSYKDVYADSLASGEPQPEEDV